MKGVMKIPKDEFISLVNSGHTIYEICDMKHISRTTAIRYMKRYNVKSPSGFHHKPGTMYIGSEEYRQFWRERMLKNNPFKGKKHTLETRQKMSKNHADFRGSKNPYRNSPNYSKNILKVSNFHRRKNLHGKRFGLLLVVDLVEYENGLMRGWKCVCDCGNETIVSTGNLCQGRQKSCGCYDLQRRWERNWKGHKEIGKSYWTRTERGARLRNIPFDISIEEGWKLFLKQQRKCALSGLDLCFNPKFRSNSGIQTASLDRIDSTKGYIKSNVQWVHKELNRLKMNTDNQRFIDLCKLVAEHHSK